MRERMGSKLNVSWPTLPDKLIDSTPRNARHHRATPRNCDASDARARASNAHGRPPFDHAHYSISRFIGGGGVPGYLHYTPPLV